MTAALTRVRVPDWNADVDPQHKMARAHAYGLLRIILTTATHDELFPANPCRIAGVGAVKSARHIRPASLTKWKCE